MLKDVIKIDVSESKRELKAHGTPDFPCAAYELRFMPHGIDSVDWHWHEELEFTVVLDGEPEFRVPGLTCTAQPGDCFCVNSNVLHYIGALKSSATCSVVFSPELLGGAGTVFARKYIHPLTANRAFTGLLIRAAEHPETFNELRRVFDAMSEEPSGYEFTVRENLSRICLYLFKRFSDSTEPTAKRNPDNERVQRMLEYIHTHYPDDLPLNAIASAANVGERECERVFRRLIGVTPKQYLIKYRVSRAAELLTECPELGISDVAAACGFNCPSVFSRTFREYCGLSPREYRAGSVRGGKAAAGNDKL